VATNNYNDFRVKTSVTEPGTVTTARGRGAVAAVSKEASELAVAVLNDGGNAFDAAFSLAFSLCVYHPQAGNNARGGYLIFKEASAGAPKVFNYREESPAGATREAFLLPDGSPDPDKTAYGPSSVCVPGTVKAFFALHERYGKLRAKDILLAVAGCAERGAPVTRYESDCLNRLGPKLAASPEARRIYVKDTPFVPGDILRNEPLSRTFEELAREGERAFYRGRIAERLVTDLAAHGGFVSADDLARYDVRQTDAIAIDFGGKRVWTPPAEAGGALLLEMLAILDRDEFRRTKPGSPEFHHLLAQAAKIAFINRLDYLGDVPLADNPVYQAILNRRDTDRLWGLIEQARDTETEALRERVRSGRPQVTITGVGGKNTTHFAVIDAEGNAVSSSYTMNLRYGSKWAVEGAGFLLNGSVDAFAFVEGKENYFGVIGSAPNLFAPRKRPASNMAPVLVTSDRGIEMAVGTPGGPTIQTTLATVLASILGHGTEPDAAIQAGRLHHQGWPDVLYEETGTVSKELVAGLSAMGYHGKDKHELICDVQGVFRERDGYLAVSDFRREGRPAAQKG